MSDYWSRCDYFFHIVYIHIVFTAWTFQTLAVGADLQVFLQALLMKNMCLFIVAKNRHQIIALKTNLAYFFFVDHEIRVKLRKFIALIAILLIFFFWVLAERIAALHAIHTMLAHFKSDHLLILLTVPANKYPVIVVLANAVPIFYFVAKLAFQIALIAFFVIAVLHRFSTLATKVVVKTNLRRIAHIADTNVFIARAFCVPFADAYVFIRNAYIAVYTHALVFFVGFTQTNNFIVVIAEHHPETAAFVYPRRRAPKRRRARAGMVF
jgi:hypothetical protein